MPVRSPVLLTVAALAIAISSPAFAKTIYASGDWSLDDSQPGVQGKGNCVAATATYLGNNGAYSLNIILDKSGIHPLEVMIRPFRSPSNAITFSVTIDSGLTYTFVKLPRTAKGEDTFWNLPRGTDKLIAQIKSSNQLIVDASNGLGELPFSMGGATAVLTQLEKRCAALPALNSAGFEKAFLPQEVNNIDFSQLDQAKANSLRDTVTRGVEAYRNTEKMKTALVTLETKYAKLNEEKAALPSAIEQLAKRDLPALASALAAIQPSIDRANADIATLKSSIAAQEVLLASAQAANDAAAAKMRPVLPEHLRLLGLKQNDEQRQASAQSALSGAEQALAAKTQELADRSAEAANLTTHKSSVADDARLRDLNQYVIPALQAEVAVQQTQKTARSNELNAARSALAKSTEALRASDVSANFAALNNEVQKAESRVSATKQEITNIKAGIASREQLVLDQAALRGDLTKKIAAAKDLIAQKTSRIAEVNQALVSYSPERKVADDNIDAAKKVLAGMSREMASQLPQTVKH